MFKWWTALISQWLKDTPEVANDNQLPASLAKISLTKLTAEANQQPVVRHDHTHNTVKINTILLSLRQTVVINHPIIHLNVLCVRRDRFYSASVSAFIHHCHCFPLQTPESDHNNGWPSHCLKQYTINTHTLQCVICEPPGQKERKNDNAEWFPTTENMKVPLCQRWWWEM